MKYVRYSLYGLVAMLAVIPMSADIVSTFTLTGNGNDIVTSMVRKPDGSFVIAGYTTSTQFDGLPDGAVLPGAGTGENAFVAIVNPDRTAISSIQFIAGKGDERANDVVVLADYRVCIVGTTNSSDFPVKGSSVGQQRGGGTDGFVAVYSADLSKQTTGILVAGNNNDEANGVAVVNTGALVVVGSTASDMGIRGQKNYDDTLAGARDAFIWVLHSSFSYVDLFTYVGGLETDAFNKVIVDPAGDIVAVGTTTSQDYFIYPRKVLVPNGEDPETGEPLYKEVGKNPYGPQPFGGASEVILTKFNLSGEPVFSTYVGGKGADEGVDLFANPDNDIVIVGNTTSNDLEISATSGTYGGMYDCFVTLVTKDGMRLGGTSYLGGSKNDFVTNVVQWSNGLGLLVGRSESGDFPIIGTATINAAGNVPNGFLAISSALSNTFSTIINVEGDETPRAVALDANRDAYIAGSNILPSMPVAETQSDAFLSKWAFGSLSYQSPSVQESLCAGQSVKVRWSTLGFSSPASMFVDFSSDNGESWTQVGADITTNSFDFTVPNNLTTDSKCLIRVRTNRGHHVQTGSPLTVGLPPVLTEQPTEMVSTCPNATITLSITVTPPTATVQWRFNNEPIIGATGATLILEQSTPAMSGEYDAIVSTPCGTIQSTVSNVLVSDAPQITMQPSSQTVGEGKSVTIAVEARGSELTYKWYLNGGPIRGTNPTTASITLDNTTTADAGSYTCEVGSACGSTTSQAATITIEGTNGVHNNTSRTLHVWPQPASSTVTIETAEITLPQSIIVRSVQGAELMRLDGSQVGQQTQSLNVSTLPSGIYVLEIQSHESVQLVPLTIVR